MDPSPCKDSASTYKKGECVCACLRVLKKNLNASLPHQINQIIKEIKIFDSFDYLKVVRTTMSVCVCVCV